jgi:hypothetical protein
MSNVKKLKLISPIAMILLVLFVSGTLLIMSGAGSTFAFVVEGSEIGLEVNVADEYTDVSNLAPGDTKGSYLTVSNTGSGAFKYFFDIQKIGSSAGSYRGQAGKHLDEKLEMTVKRNEEELFKGLVAEFREQFGDKGRDMGVLNGGESQQLDISVHLSGPETGNEYQGADVTVQFKFRADPAQEEDAGLEVRKFRDNNRNGIWDAGEPEITGWTIYINDEQYSTPQTLKFAPGIYTVREGSREEWRASTETEYTVTLAAEESKTVLFGNYRVSSPPPPPPPPPPGDEEASLAVYKFYDADADGIWDDGEEEIEGWIIYINDEKYSTPQTLELEPGTYTVREEAREGWRASTPTEYTVTLVAGAQETVLFGNYETPSPPPPPPPSGKASLAVYKFNDADADGVWDDNEEQIAGWKVFINGEEYTTPLTLELDPGEYTLTEEIVEGWEAATPAEVVVALEEGDRETVIFGNYQETEIIVPPEGPESPPRDSSQLIEEEIPPEPPKTGEFPPAILYGAGLLLVLAGLALRRKALSRARGARRSGGRVK